MSTEYWGSAKILAPGESLRWSWQRPARRDGPTTSIVKRVTPCAVRWQGSKTKTSSLLGLNERIPGSLTRATRAPTPTVSGLTMVR